MTTPANAIDVRDNTEDRRFEIWVEGQLAGFTTYVLRPGFISFMHTELDPSFQGQGLGQELVAAALRSASQRGLQVLPFCPYVRGFIAQHPEFLDLVPEQDRARFDLCSGLAPGAQWVPFESLQPLLKRPAFAGLFRPAVAGAAEPRRLRSAVSCCSRSGR